jgi:hypothetical protein
MELDHALGDRLLDSDPALRWQVERGETVAPWATHFAYPSAGSPAP